MNYDTIIRFVILIGILQGFLFNLFVFFSWKKFDISVKYLNIVVLCLSLNNVREFIFDGNHFNQSIDYFYWACPWYFLVVPMFFVFLIYYLKMQDKMKSYVFLTYAIFLVETIIRISLIVFSDNLETIFQEYMIVEEMCNSVYSIFIFYKIIRLIFFDKNALDEIVNFDNIQWIKNTLKFGFILMIFWVFAVIYYSFTRNAVVYDPLKIMYSILIYWIGYQSLIHSKVLKDRIFIRKHIEKDFEISLLKQNKKKSLNEKNETNFKSIEDYVINEQRFLDPLFSLEKLAQEFNISVSQLSKLINNYSTSNFSDYINSLRVNQAKKLLGDNTFNQYTIVAIGLESGFNSKSTFYTAFKKFTSQTPSEYRLANNY